MKSAVEEGASIEVIKRGETWVPDLRNGYDKIKMSGDIRQGEDVYFCITCTTYFCDLLAE